MGRWMGVGGAEDLNLGHFLLDMQFLPTTYFRSLNELHYQTMIALIMMLQTLNHDMIRSTSSEGKGYKCFLIITLSVLLKDLTFLFF